MRGYERFNALRRRLPNVTQRMLTNQLRELEADGLVHRTVYAEVPPRVEYRLTERGRTLEPVIRALKAWGDTHAMPGPAAEAAFPAGALATRTAAQNFGDGRPSFLPTPGFGLRLMLGEGAQIITTGQRVVPKKAQEMGYHFKVTEVESALKDLLVRFGQSDAW